MAKIELTGLNLIAHWELDVSTQDCGLCRQSLIAPSPQDFIDKNSTTINITNNVVLGTCKHVFHKKCIETLYVNGACLCPTDHSPWKVDKILITGVSYDILSTNNMNAEAQSIIDAMNNKYKKNIF